MCSSYILSGFSAIHKLLLQHIRREQAESSSFICGFGERPRGGMRRTLLSIIIARPFHAHFRIGLLPRRAANSREAQCTWKTPKLPSTGFRGYNSLTVESGSAVQEGQTSGHYNGCPTVQRDRRDTGTGHRGSNGRHTNYFKWDWIHCSQVDEEERPMSYTQVFQLLPDAGSYFVFNDVFKLIYPL